MTPVDAYAVHRRRFLRDLAREWDGTLSAEASDALVERAYVRTETVGPTFRGRTNGIEVRRAEG